MVDRAITKLPRGSGKCLVRRLLCLVEGSFWLPPCSKRNDRLLDEIYGPPSGAPGKTVDTR
jgi:hypothetical protein